ncbi:MAG: tryptophan--tRNA ligase, partial [Cyanobacteria bacterium J06636_28]
RAPSARIRASGARVMSLSDGTKKMSKSDPSELSRIEIGDTPELIKKKIKKCKTDPMRGLEFGNPERPECNNLLTLYMLLSGKEKDAVAAECADMGWGQFKPLLTETAIAALQPIQENYQALMDDRGYLESVLKQGNEKARMIANGTLTKVKDALGYARPL